MNILILTSVYPSNDMDNGNVTKVVQYFAKEWSVDHHIVKVIHNVHRYPTCVHRLPHSFRSFIAGKVGFLIPNLEAVRKKTFFDDDVQVFCLPIFKFIPHGGHTSNAIKKHVLEITSLMSKERFKPDIILGHWMSPQAQLISQLKQIFDCKTSLVLHGCGYINNRSFHAEKYLKNIDAIGCRSKSDAIAIQEALSLRKTPFVCYSGIPDRVAADFSFDTEKFNSTPVLWRIVYAGRLVAYKNINKTLIALSRLKESNFIFDIIGSGGEEASLKKLAADLGIDKQVVFHGRMPREQVLEYMRKAHCFVMVSKDEVFGLVYLEAMISSCITIGSISEGIDGVIESGVNGFLCNPDDENDLAATLDSIMSKAPSQLQKYALNGYNTASRFTDSNVAQWYLDDAIHYIK